MLPFRVLYMNGIISPKRHNPVQIFLDLSAVQDGCQVVLIGYAFQLVPPIVLPV